jgi:dephospho-CoA kinase
VEIFGAEIVGPSGGLDRAALRGVVFRDPAARARLEAIVHPEVARLRGEEEARAERAGIAIVVNDNPLLFEVGLEDEFDLVVLVDAPEEVRVARLVRERGLDEGEARRMVAAQMPAAAKRERADYLIENDGSLQELEARAEGVWQVLRRRAGGEKGSGPAITDRR